MNLLLSRDSLSRSLRRKKSLRLKGKIYWDRPSEKEICKRRILKIQGNF